MASGLGRMLPVLRKPRHVDAAVEVVVHRAGAAVGAAVDQRALLGKAEHERIGARRGGGDAVVVGLHARRQIQQRVDVAIDQRQALDRRGVDGLRDVGGRGVDVGRSRPSTVTVSVTPPSASDASTRAVSLTLRTMPLRRVGLESRRG